MNHKVTVYDVAKAAGVSPATVSRVLNHKGQVTNPTCQKVLGAIKQLGFVQRKPNIYHTSAYKNAIATPLLLFSIPSISNSFYTEIIRGAQAAAIKYGYYLLTDCKPINGINIDSLINLIRSYKISGIVVADTISDTLLDTLKNLVPVVQCSEYNPGTSTLYVSIDNFAASKKAVEYILSTDRRGVAFFSTPMRFHYAQQRRAGYLEALKNAGIIPRKDWIIYVPEIDFELAFQASLSLFSKPPIPDAIYTVSDVLAAAAIKAIQVSGLNVPNDILVVGFDNIDISITTSPTITTVAQPRFQLGYRSVELLVENLIGTDHSLQQTILNTELIIRESSTLI